MRKFWLPKDALEHQGGESRLPRYTEKPKSLGLARRANRSERESLHAPRADDYGYAMAAKAQEGENHHASTQGEVERHPGRVGRGSEVEVEEESQDSQKEPQHSVQHGALGAYGDGRGKTRYRVQLQLLQQPACSPSSGACGSALPEQDDNRTPDRLRFRRRPQQRPQDI